MEKKDYECPRPGSRNGHQSAKGLSTCEARWLPCFETWQTLCDSHRKL